MVRETKPNVGTEEARSRWERRPTVHVDTSLQIEQQKIPAKSSKVRQALEQYAFRSTSTFAKKEFKRAWLQDLNLIYKVSKDCKDIGDVYSAIEKSLWHPKVRRRLQRCTDAMAAFLKELPEKTSVGVLVIRLRAHLAEAILTGFMAWERSVTHEYNGTDCIRAKERPIRAANGTIDVSVRACRPSKIQCSVHRFFEQNRQLFLDIDEAIQATPEPSAELRETSKMIHAASSDSKVLCDSDHCRRMSDALIAVDGVAMDHFAANNPREWPTLAKALGKPLINPCSTGDVESLLPKIGEA